ncbi:MAG: outer membrane beta-barrel protein [Qipengyuania sp.]
MNKFVLSAAIGLAAVTLPAAAQAQEAAVGPYVGLSAGYHDLGVDSDDPDFGGFEINDSSPILGVIGGVDFPLGSSAFAGVEGNYHFGTDVIDSEYGGSARLGFRAEGGAKFYVRGGYQVLDLDPYKIVDVDLPDGSLDDVDDSDGDYLVGVGADFPVGASSLRVNLDTVSFDTLRATVGFAFGF